MTPMMALWARKQTGDWRFVAPSAFSIPISRVFLDDESDLRTQDAKRGDEDDEKQQIKHDIFFNDQRIKNAGILFHPGRNINSPRAMFLFVF